MSRIVTVAADRGGIVSPRRPFRHCSGANITHVFYDRDVGCVVERIALDDNIEAISATQLRRLITER